MGSRIFRRAVLALALASQVSGCLETIGRPNDRGPAAPPIGLCPLTPKSTDYVAGYGCPAKQ